MGGTAISALTTVKLFDEGEKALPDTAAVLAVYAWWRGSCCATPPGASYPESLMTRLAANSRLRITWQACILTPWVRWVRRVLGLLPAYLKTAHHLTAADAANRMAGFVVVAVLIARGWLAR